MRIFQVQPIRNFQDNPMNFSTAINIGLVAQRSVIVNISDFKNPDALETILAHHCHHLSILNCNSQSPDEIFNFFIQAPKLAQRKGRGSEIIIEDSKSDKKTGKHSRVATSHNTPTNTPKLEPSTRVRTRDSNVSDHVTILYHIDKLSRRSQEAIMEIMIHKNVEVNGKMYSLSPNLMIFATCCEFFTIHNQLLDHFLISCETEDSIVQSPSNLDLKALRDSLLKSHVNLKVTQFIRDIVISCRHHESVKERPTPKTYDCMTLAAQTLATLCSSPFVTSTHVSQITPSVLSHRILKSPKFLISLLEDLTHPL